ncbi:MAG: c-type cytochrome [Roseobacter sp.]
MTTVIPVRLSTQFRPRLFKPRHVVLFWCTIVAFNFCLAPLSAQEFFTLKGHGGPIKGIDAAPDGTIVTASFDNSVGLWRDGSAHWMEEHTAAVNAVAYLEGSRVVSAGDDFSVRLWDAQNAKTHLLGHHQAKVIQLAMAPDGERVASASWDRTARIWSVNQNTPPVEISGHLNTVNDVAFSPDGNRLYTASSDGTIRISNSETGAFEQRLVEHGFGINMIVVAQDETWLAYGAVDGTTRIVSLPDGVEMRDFTADRRPVLAMSYHPKLERIAVGDAHGYIMMIDTQRWRIVDDFRATLSGPIWALRFSPNGDNIHAGGLDNAMYSWPVAQLDRQKAMTDTDRSFLKNPEEMSNGERQFQRKCSICHTLGPDSERRAGPTLYGLFGRPAGTVKTYPYSPTLETAQLIWSESTVDRLFDIGPDHFIPGSKMPMQRITVQTDRDDLIAFLKAATKSDPGTP